MASPMVDGSKEVVIKIFDMSLEMQQDAIKTATLALESCKLEKDIAAYIKTAFDKRYKTTNWNCVVGRQFGSYVTHETGHFIYFYLDHVAFLLFKTLKYGPENG